ncbi:MAG: sulfatase [Pirellulaceae bacterium]|nr:MAG: sulfatase [Pirellulaceae bacterium]
MIHRAMSSNVGKPTNWQASAWLASRLAVWTFVLGAALGAAGDGTVTMAADRPNIVFILVDDLGKMDLGCEGSTFYETPNIDSLAARSMRFTHGYSACQVCSPSRAAIQTGKAPPRVRITDYIAPSGNNQPEQWGRNTRLLPASFRKELALEEVTIAEALKELGYSTFFAGKWHLGGEGFYPEDQGYDINIGGHEAGTPPGGYFAPYRNPKLQGPPGEYLPLRLGRQTAEFIHQAKDDDRPFFAMLSFYSVHAPIQTTEALWRKYRDKAERMGLAVPRQRFLFDRTQEVRQVQDNPLYAGMMEALDKAVGTVLDAIDDSGQADNTIIVFTSDNGGVTSGDGYATSALPMRGGKGRQWEGGIRQPFYIYVPGLTHGQENATLAIGTDFFPTLIELAGGTPPEGLDGISLVPALRGEQLVDRALFWHYPHYGNQGGEPSAIMRHGSWKLIHYYEDGRNELYNVEDDIGEQHDVAAVHPQRVQSMWRELHSWLEQVGAVFPTPNPRFDQEKYEQALAQARTVRMANREREHFQFLQPDFVPRGGWWERRGR